MEAPNENEVRAALDFIKQYCMENKLTVAVGESVSSGLLQALFSSEKEAGLFFEGGITTYSCKQKERHFGIPQEICDPCHGVSEEISQRIALKTCDLFACKLALSLTGYASPIPEENVQELFAYGTVVLDGEVRYSGKIESGNNQPEEIRADYANFIVVTCARILRDR